MPRISRDAADVLQLVANKHPAEVVARLVPPSELTKEQREEWLRVVDTMPADWFVPGNAAALAQYCRHVGRGASSRRWRCRQRRGTNELLQMRVSFRQLRTSRRIRLGSCVPFPEVGAAPFDCASMAVGDGVATQAQCRESTQVRSMARFASVANSVHGHAPSSLTLHPSIFTTAVSGGRARSSGTMRRIWSSV